MYKLLTPGPLTTSETVKNAMLIDHCAWDQEYKEITQWIRKKLLDLAQVSEGIYTTVLMQGSGSFGGRIGIKFCDQARRYCTDLFKRRIWTTNDQHVRMSETELYRL